MLILWAHLKKKKLDQIKEQFHLWKRIRIALWVRSKRHLIIETFMRSWTDAFKKLRRFDKDPSSLLLLNFSSYFIRIVFLYIWRITGWRMLMVMIFPISPQHMLLSDIFLLNMQGPYLALWFCLRCLLPTRQLSDNLGCSFQNFQSSAL